MKKISTIALTVLLLACQNQKNTDVLDLEEILPSSEAYDGKQESVTPQHKAYNSIIPLASFHKNGLMEVDSLTGFDELHFLDRFENEELDKFIVHQGNKETQVWVYRFKKGKANNAFVNWLNCFSTNCEQINLMDDAYIPKESLTIWQNDQSIIIVGRALVSEKEQMKWLNSFRLEFGLNWNYQLVLQKGKVIAWTKDIELKEI